jgi:hypothetical protein
VDPNSDDRFRPRERQGLAEILRRTPGHAAHAFGFSTEGTRQVARRPRLVAEREASRERSEDLGRRQQVRECERGLMAMMPFAGIGSIGYPH